MKIKNIKIHNFRSILDGRFNLGNYTLLVGKNNTGKTTVTSTIRTFWKIANRNFLKVETSKRMKQ